MTSYLKRYAEKAQGIDSKDSIVEYVDPATSKDLEALDDKDEEPLDDDDIPVIFATIHYKSDKRPNGYTMEDIAEINRKANEHRKNKVA